MPAAAYATRADLPRFGLRSPALSGIATADQDRALLVASRFFDTLIGPRHAPPLTTWGDDVTRAVCIIAAWDLIGEKGFSPDSPGGGNWLVRYEQIVSWAKDVGAGRAVLVGVVDSSPDTEGGSPEVYSVEPRGW